jgi:hypothetical protein
MRDYRLYVTGPDGHITACLKFWCDDDEAAKERANQYRDGHDLELWHQGEKIATLLAGCSCGGSPKPSASWSSWG